MDFPLLGILKDLLIEPFRPHTHPKIPRALACGTWCNLWTNGQYSFATEEQTPSTMTQKISFPALVPTPTYMPTIASPTTTTESRESIADFRIPIDQVSDYVRSFKGVTTPWPPGMAAPGLPSPITILPSTDQDTTTLPLSPKTNTTFVTSSELTETSLLASVTTLNPEFPATPTTPPANIRNGGGLSTKITIAIAVPVSITGFAIIAGLLFCLLRRRRQKQRNAPITPVEASPSFLPAVPKMEPAWDLGPSSTTRASTATQSDRLPETQVCSPSIPLDSWPLAERGGVKGRFTEQVHSIHSEHLAIGTPTTPTALTVANMSIHGQHTPRSPAWTLSPFEDPPGDARSEVSTITERDRRLTQHRDLDEVSSISSLDENDRRRHL